MARLDALEKRGEAELAQAGEHRGAAARSPHSSPLRLSIDDRTDSASFFGAYRQVASPNRADEAARRRRTARRGCPPMTPTVRRDRENAVQDQFRSASMRGRRNDGQDRSICRSEKLRSWNNGEREGNTRASLRQRRYASLWHSAFLGHRGTIACAQPHAISFGSLDRSFRSRHAAGARARSAVLNSST
jgi:hypothetical protein